MIHLANENRSSRDMDLDVLLGAIAGHEPAALESLYHATKTSIYSFALSILKNAHDAEDVLQECYVKIYFGASGYIPCGKPMAWILTITRNLCLEKLRQQGKTQEISYKFMMEIPINGSITVEDKIILEQCMERLSDEERQIIILHIIAGMKHRETAEFLGKPLFTILSKYHRALKKLKKHLSEEGIYDV